MAEGQLVRHGVLPFTGARGWGDCLEAHMDHAWLMMRSHAQGETRVHSGGIGALGGGGRATTTTGVTTNNAGDDDTRSRSSTGSRGKGLGQPRKANRARPPLLSVPVVLPTAQVADWLQQQQA